VAFSRGVQPALDVAAMQQKQPAEPVAIKVVPPPMERTPDEKPEKKQPRSPDKQQVIARKAPQDPGNTPAKKSLASVADKAGSCPSITIVYDNPVSYIRNMYRLGAITLIADANFDSVYRIDLLQETLQNIDRKTLGGFSAFKRVVNDRNWHQQKIRFAKQLRSSPDTIEILLLIPDAIEAQWVDHILTVGRNQDIQSEDIVSVVCHLGQSFTIRHFVCKSGVQIAAQDARGA